MTLSDQLLEAGEDLRAAQKAHPLVRELVAGSLAEPAFLHWLCQDYRYLLDYARTFALAGVRVREMAYTEAGWAA